MADVILERRITGYGSVTALNATTSWTYSDKLEVDFVGNSSDGARTIDLTNINDIVFMSFESDSAFTLTITAGGNTIAFGVNDIFEFSPTDVFEATITSLTVTSLSASDTTISVRLYGE